MGKGRLSVVSAHFVIQAARSTM